MNSFESHRIVSQEDLDELNHVNNVRYVQWVQDVAEQHWQTKASAEIRSAYFWVLLQHHITYKHPAVLNDRIALKTYVKSSSGVTCVRIVEIYNRAINKLLAVSETTWGLLSQKNKRPTRITDEIKILFD